MLQILAFRVANWKGLEYALLRSFEEIECAKEKKIGVSNNV